MLHYCRCKDEGKWERRGTAFDFAIKGAQAQHEYKEYNFKYAVHAF